MSHEFAFIRYDVGYPELLPLLLLQCSGTRAASIYTKLQWKYRETHDKFISSLEIVVEVEL